MNSPMEKIEKLNLLSHQESPRESQNLVGHLDGNTIRKACSDVTDHMQVDGEQPNRKFCLRDEDSEMDLDNNGDIKE
ncbi:hypothetical protein ACH5RR_012786 [Cinchona calisaya]|uniref:Uncharacterized protein n=1 Tax=Cinchona calisaya TaxID=153742 RepID=A0ABD3AC56_9GENT